ncbi:RNA polymerase subunit sigma-24 [Dyadobacter luteus]|jgi:RNA polymerase sigma factor (sigma-70 family)|uniref:RNA polymerase subunit sigma-24 n=1 Tax=Dyadobacter luteus TaxID=2259619 RepID=A0A3D8Y4V7_9BACT|nr:sigma-70 family RNA polymerase sigma factor [Dyadobacter luteus]REA57489.1 RNA polymerase subunit sigma-24 [Dyadobacter luteus]
MKQSEEQVWIENVKNGDPSSYSFLVNRYKDMAYTIALKILKSAEDAEDAAQESFIKAYQQLYSFQGAAKFSTWLYTIVYRTSISKLNRNRILTYSIDEDLNEDYIYDYSDSQLDQLQHTERSVFVRKAIGKLPESESLLITLFYLNENTVKEIEEITGMSESNIKVKLFRARKILEKELQFLL